MEEKRTPISGSRPGSGSYTGRTAGNVDAQSHNSSPLVARRAELGGDWLHPGTVSVTGEREPGSAGVGLSLARQQFALRTSRGAGNLLAAVVIWLALGVAGVALPDRQGLGLIYVAACALFWPLGALITRLIGAQSLVMGNSLSHLKLLVEGSFMLCMPVVAVIYMADPDLVPSFLAILLSAQYLLFIWLFESFAYLFGALAIVEVAVLLAWLTPHASLVATPFCIAGALLLTVMFLYRQLGADRAGDVSNQ